MSRKIQLSSYPHLHNILKNDPQANAQFNKAISDLMLPVQSQSTVAFERDALSERLLETLTKLQKVTEAYSAVRKQVTLLGNVLEPQVHLSAYTQDLADDAQYKVTFSAEQVRAALSMHWDIVAQSVEDRIAGRTEEEPVD